VRRVADLLSGRAADGAYAAGWAVVRTLPEPVAARLFTPAPTSRPPGAGPPSTGCAPTWPACAPRATSTPHPRRAAQLRPLLARGLPPARHLGRAGRVGHARPRRERIFDAAAQGRGVICALPHSGNWDHAGAWLVGRGVRFTTVAERLKPEQLYDRFVAFRESLGMEVLPLTGGRPPFEVLVERLRAGGVLCLLSDRDLSARGVDVEFFGAATRMPAGPASLALRTGAVLLPVTLSFRPDGWDCAFHPPVPHTDVATMTQQVADAFASGIAAAPADWHMLQRLWLEDLAPDDPRRAPR
jgi:KDO2-lipid IV(A) lauroyltransferase